MTATAIDWHRCLFLILKAILLIALLWADDAFAAVCPPRPIDCNTNIQGANQSGRYCIDQTFAGDLQVSSTIQYVWIAPGVNVELTGELDYSGTLVNCGELKFDEVNVTEGFLFKNYANATMDKPWLFTGAGEIVNYSQGLLRFSVPISLKNNAKIVNDGQLVSLANLQSDPGTTLVNKGFLNIVGGNFDPNGLVDNQGFIETNRFININSQSTVVNNCKFIADQGFNNNSPSTVNNGYIFVGENALLQMNADFHQTDKGFVVGAHFLSSGAITGAGAYHFTGDTRSQGTFGLDGLGINFYDASSMGGKIFDFQGAPPHPSVTRRFIEPPLADGIAPRCSPELVDQFPVIMISAIAGDDILDLNEDKFPLEIAGIAMHVENGQRVSIEIAGQMYSATVFAGVWSITLSADVAANLPENNQVIANVANQAGEPAQSAVRSFVHLQPMPKITIAPVAMDDVINATEDDFSVVVFGETFDVEPQQRVMLVIAGKIFEATVENNAWQITLAADFVSSLPAQFTITADVTTRTGIPAPSATRVVSHTVDLPSIMILPVANDDIISLKEQDFDVEVRGVTANVEPDQLVELLIANERYTTTTNGENWAAIIPSSVAMALPPMSQFRANVSNRAGDAAPTAVRDVTHIVGRPELTISAIANDDYVNSLESLAPVLLQGFALNIRDGLWIDVLVTLAQGEFNQQAQVVNARWQITLPTEIVSQLASTFRVEVKGKNHVDDIAETVMRVARRAIVSDSDGDGLPDAYEGGEDFDSDGLADYLDTDSDNDGILDRIEGFDDFTDVNQNGINDRFDVLITGGMDANFDDVDDAAIARDFDGDGSVDFRDLDSDNDGIQDAIESDGDHDHDGLANYLDLDSDADGVFDAIEGQVLNDVAMDTDKDGIANFLDTDSDNDGLTDSLEAPNGIVIDNDGDGIADLYDSDSDNDGISDAIESGYVVDFDQDGIADHVDADFHRVIFTRNDQYWMDADGDGIADGADAEVFGEIKTDINHDGIWDAAFWRDSDGDSVPDFLDIDSDNDGVPDADEVGGYFDAQVVLTGRFNSLATPQIFIRDSDGDGFYDHLDLDSDNDGLSDALESGLSQLDPDGDGKIGGNIIADNNRDGWSDLADPTISGFRALARDSNFDGVPDRLSLDSDGDGLFDNLEILGEQFVERWDINHDGAVDLIFSEDTLIAPVSPSATALNIIDGNSNGVDDGIEAYLQILGILTDAPALQDFDRDGYLDVLEVRYGGNPLNAAEADGNGNGVPDWVEATDMNGNGRNDGDGDGFTDLLEWAAGLDLIVANEKFSALTAIENTLLNPSRYRGRNAEPAVWIDVLQFNRCIVQAAINQPVRLSARLGNYHVFDDEAQGTASEKPEFIWTNVDGVMLGKGASIVLESLPEGESTVQLAVLWHGQRFVAHTSIQSGIEAVGDDDCDGIADELDHHHAELGYLQTLYSSKSDQSVIGAFVDLDSGNLHWQDRAMRSRLGFYAKKFGKAYVHFSPEQLPVSFIAGEENTAYDGSTHEKTTTTREYFGDAYHFDVINLPYAGSVVNVILKLNAPLSAKVQLHQWQGDRWAENIDVYSSAAIAGQCIEHPENELSIGLRASFECLHLMIEDGGAYDADSEKNGVVEVLLGFSIERETRVKGSITTGVAGGALSLLWGMLCAIILLMRGLISRSANRVAMQRCWKIPFIVAAALIANMSYAEPKRCESSKQFNAEKGGYTCRGLYGGFGGLAASLTPEISNVPEFLVEDSYGLGIHGFAGYDINAYWSVEGHYSDQGHAVFASGAKIRYRYAGYSALFHLTNHLPHFNVYAKTGIGWLETQLDQGREDHLGFSFEQKNDQQIHWGLGAELQSQHGLGIRTEFLWVDQDSQQVSLSLVKRFGQVVKPIKSRTTDSQAANKDK